MTFIYLKLQVAYVGKAEIAQLVRGRADDCFLEGRGFQSRHAPFNKTRGHYISQHAVNLEQKFYFF